MGIEFILLILLSLPLLCGAQTISNCPDLQNMQNNLTGIYTLSNDLDCASTIFFPVGNLTFPFQGSLYGGGFKIMNVSIKASQDNVELFGAGMGCTVSNLTLVDFSVISSSITNNTGLLFGLATNGTIVSRVNVTATVQQSRVSSIGGQLN